MASTRSHRAATALLAVGLLSYWNPIGWLLSIGAAFTLWAHPDKDMPLKTGCNPTRLFWYPYQRIIWLLSRAGGWRELHEGSGGHRSPLSHWPMLGTAGRLAYLALFIGWFVPERWYAVLFVVACGIALSDTLHAAMDWPRLRGIFRQ